MYDYYIVLINIINNIIIISFLLSSVLVLHNILKCSWSLGMEIDPVLPLYLYYTYVVSDIISS